MCDGMPLQITGDGSLFKISATPYPLDNYRTTLTVDRQWQSTASMALMNDGFFLNCELNGCIATTTTDAHLDAFLSAVERLFRSPLMAVSLRRGRKLYAERSCRGFSAS